MSRFPSACDMPLIFFSLLQYMAKEINYACLNYVTLYRFLLCPILGPHKTGENVVVFDFIMFTVLRRSAFQRDALKCDACY